MLIIIVSVSVLWVHTLRNRKQRRKERGGNIAGIDTRQPI